MIPTGHPGCCPVAPPVLAVLTLLGNTDPGTAQCVGVASLPLAAVASKQFQLKNCNFGNSSAEALSQCLQQLALTWHSKKYLRAMSATPALPCSRSASCSRLPVHTIPFISSSSTLPIYLSTRRVDSMEHKTLELWDILESLPPTCHPRKPYPLAEVVPACETIK